MPRQGCPRRRSRRSREPGALVGSRRSPPCRSRPRRSGSGLRGPPGIWPHRQDGRSWRQRCLRPALVGLSWRGAFPPSLRRPGVRLSGPGRSARHRIGPAVEVRAAPAQAGRGWAALVLAGQVGFGLALAAAGPVAVAPCGWVSPDRAGPGPARLGRARRAALARPGGIGLGIALAPARPAGIGLTGRSGRSRPRRPSSLRLGHRAGLDLRGARVAARNRSPVSSTWNAGSSSARARVARTVSRIRAGTGRRGRDRGAGLVNPATRPGARGQGVMPIRSLPGVRWGGPTKICRRSRQERRARIGIVPSWLGHLVSDVSRCGISNKRVPVVFAAWMPRRLRGGIRW